MATIYSKLINQYKFKNHILFSARFYKINEADQRNDEINLNINKNLTETEINDIDVKSQLEHQIQTQELKESGWIFDKINSMKIGFYETEELNGSSHIKIPLRSNALKNNKNNDKNCFISSILASLHPCDNDHPNRVSNYIQYFNELNFQSFDFTNGFKCSDFHKFIDLNNLSVNIFELNFYQDKNKWKHNLIPIEISKNESDRVVDLLIYKNHCKLKIKCPDDEEIERTKKIIKILDIKRGEELTGIYLKSDVLLLACVFEKFIKVTINEFGINPLYCVSLPGYTWQCGLKYTGVNLKTLQDKDLILLLENNIRGGISSVMGDRYVKSSNTKKILY